MFLKKNPNHFISEGSKNLLEEKILNLKVAQTNLLYKIQTRRIYKGDPDTDPVIDFSKSQEIEYNKNLILKDLTTDEQTDLGISILHVLVKDSIDSLPHQHKSRYQLIYIIKGMLVDVINNIEYKEGETMFIEKNIAHSLRYIKNSELMLINIPGLDIISNYFIQN